MEGLVTRKRERLGKSYLNDQMFSLMQPGWTRAEDDGSHALPTWSKSWGWSRTRSVRSKNIKWSWTQNNWWCSADSRKRRREGYRSLMANGFFQGYL